MGATGISISFNSDDWKKTMKKIHDEATTRYTGRYCEDATYSGDWNTVSVSRCIKALDKYSETKASSWISKNLDKTWDNVSKRDGVAIDFGVIRYEVWSVKKVTPTGKKAPKYETKFIVYHIDGMGREAEDSYETTVTAANNKAMKLAVENDRYYHVKKTRVLVSGSEETATFQIVKKQYKSKPKSVKKGGTLKEIHNYYVLGMAAC